MDDETVDRVARAIYACVGSPLRGECPWWVALDDAAQEFLRKQARAAIAAMESAQQEEVAGAGGIK